MRSLINMVCVYLLLTGRACLGPRPGEGLRVADFNRLYCSNSKAIGIVHCWTYNFCVLGLMCGLLS